MLAASSPYLDLEGAVGGFVAVGHVAAGAIALGGLQSGGGIIEFTLGDKYIDLGQAVGTVEGESHPVGDISGLPIGHDHGQVLLELADVGVGRGAVFGGQILIEIGGSGGIGFHPALIFSEIVAALSPEHGAHQERAHRQTEGKFHGTPPTRIYGHNFRASYASPACDTTNGICGWWSV